jgi:hypothetical protein
MKHLIPALLLVLLGSLPVSATVSALRSDENEIRLWNGPRAGLGELVYTIRLDTENAPPVHQVYVGIDVGRPMFAFDNAHFYNGPNRRSRPIYTLDGPRVHLGPDNNAPAIYLVQNGRVRRGANNNGPIVFTITRFRVYEGPNTNGPIVLSSNRDLLHSDVPLDRVIPILLELELRGGGPDAP